MNNFISQQSINHYINEDVPYFDLTTNLLEIGDIEGIITYKTRELTVVACVEEAIKVMETLGLKVTYFKPSGTILEAGELILQGEGSAKALHQAWKVIVNILEYSSGVATRTYRFVSEARKANPDVHILSTRKVFPGTKELAIKGVLAGGGYPHRLGLSESILIFDQHLNFFNSREEIAVAIKKVKKHSLEKKVMVEVQSEEDAFFYMDLNIDGMQFDKFSCEELKKLVSKLKKEKPSLFLVAAGGINLQNIQEYAKTGVDGLVTSAMYFGKPSDIEAKLLPIRI